MTVKTLKNTTKRFDRIRILDGEASCGQSDKGHLMSPGISEWAAPNKGPDEIVSANEIVWHNVVFIKKKMFRLCWCMGNSALSADQDCSIPARFSVEVAMFQVGGPPNNDGDQLDMQAVPPPPAPFFLRPESFAV